MRKLLALVLSLVLMLTVAAPAVAAELSNDVVILYTNDVHTYIDGELSYDVIAAVKKQLQAEYNYVLLVDAGDHVQGTAYGSMDKGETIIKLMNAAKYDVATLGNHEFDYGMEGCIAVRDWAEFPYVSANFYHEENNVRNENVLDSFVAVPCGKVTVALVGATTPETFTKSTPAYFQDGNGNYIFGIAGGEDGAALYADVQDAINEAKTAGATVIIGLAHLGDDPSSSPWTSEETIANVSGFDAFIDGHSHSKVEYKEVADKDGNTVVLTQTGEYYGRIGAMKIDAETGAITTDFIEVEEIVEVTKNDKGEDVENVIGYNLVSELFPNVKYASDEAVAAIKNDWMKKIDEQLGTVIGSTALTFDNYDADGKRLVRSQETNTGDFAADALYYLFDNMGLDVDVAIMNGGGVRNKALTGDFSYKTAKEIHTFGNVACLQTITGQQLLDALEWGARGTPNEEIGGFLHVSGITYEIDPTVPSTVQADEKGVWVGGPTGEYRVKNVKINQNGEYVALDLDAQYNLAGYNYTLRDLGDGFAMFDGAINVLDYVMEDYMVLANYIKSFPVDETTGLPTVTAENSPYGSVYGEGRVKLVEKKGFDDVPAGSYYAEPVAWAQEEGITVGVGDNNFNPTGSLRRSQIVVMLWRAAGEPKAANTVNPFSDVAESDYYYDAVLWALEEGITCGVSATKFDPSGVASRAQTVTFLWRYLDKPESTTTASFSDVVAGKWYEAAINWAVENSITLGMGDGTFGVDVTCTRAHAVTFLYRALAE